MRILLVEDDDSLAQAVAAVLSKQNYVVDIAADGEAGWELVTVCNYDLILLDVILPKLDGISLCRQLRQEGYKMPILLLTAKDSRTDKVMGLDAGADDYVVKPFDFGELSARIRALGRRGNSSLPPVLEWGNLRLDPSSCEVTYAGNVLHITAKEYSILELFLRNNQRTFSRSAIVDHLWGADTDPPADDTIKSHIKSLRQKLKAAGAPYNFIETVYGLGYRLKPDAKKQKSQESKEEPTPTQQEIFSAAVAKAREDFQAKVGSRITVLEQASNALKEGTLNSGLQQNAEQEAHKLAGSLGSFGFARGSLLAEKIESILQSQTPINQVQSQHLCELVTELQRELEKTTTDEQILSEQRQKMLLIVSGDRQVVEQLVKEAATQGMHIDIAINTADARSAIESSSPDVVLLDLDCSDEVKDSLKLLTELSNRTPPIPVLVFTDRSNFAERLEVARAGGRSFLHKSMPPKQMLELVIQTIQSISVSKTRVMVVDDDPQVLTLIWNLLEPWGIKLTTLEDPRRFWETLTEFSPDLLVLDIKMPHVNGIELCQVVRNDPYWSKLPVLFLTAHVTADTVDRIFAAGADDCISKPIEGAKLITRIFKRLELISKKT
ncbi:response regulator [Chlorogloeopsis fritschii PCC 9212]|uniref:Transcriptional regulator n=1 Tax=Chlorogloeopsis fritschii PCC 6912 TaxID=211165 RepID=A0A433N400_CHLFR|nr:response regulator [Chlorogloeopsis fritschii]RUR75985.1 transcriptional regulator [Chlorogloeopsis fritschii PCC 6912]